MEATPRREHMAEAAAAAGPASRGDVLVEPPRRASRAQHRLRVREPGSRSTLRLGLRHLCPAHGRGPAVVDRRLHGYREVPARVLPGLRGRRTRARRKGPPPQARPRTQRVPARVADHTVRPRLLPVMTDQGSLARSQATAPDGYSATSITAPRSRARWMTSLSSSK